AREARSRRPPPIPEQQLAPFAPPLPPRPQPLPPEVPATHGEVADSLRVTDGVSDRDLGALREPEQRKPLDASGLDHRLEVGHPCVEREVLDLPVGEPCPALVVSDDLVGLAEPRQPGMPERAPPVELEVREPVRRLDERWALPSRGVGEAD